jgi:hypothetical protein
MMVERHCRALRILILCGSLLFLPVVMADVDVRWDSTPEWKAGAGDNTYVSGGRVKIGFFPQGEWKISSEVDCPWGLDGITTEWREETGELCLGVYDRGPFFGGGEGEYARVRVLATYTFYWESNYALVAFPLRFKWKASPWYGYGEGNNFDQGNSETSLTIRLQKPDGNWVQISGSENLWQRLYHQPVTTSEEGVAIVSIPHEELERQGLYTLYVEGYWYLDTDGGSEKFTWLLSDFCFCVSRRGVHVTEWRDMGSVCARSSSATPPSWATARKQLL